MRIRKFGIACFFLILVAMFTIQSKYGILFHPDQAYALSNALVTWNIDKDKGSGTFVLQNEKGEPLGGIGENQQNQMVIYAVNNGLTQYEEIKPTYIGKGTFTFQYPFKQTTTLFLYIKDNETRQELAKKEIVVETRDAKQTPITVDALLTSKIGPYDASLQFSALKANRNENIMLQFESKDNLIFTAPTGELSRFLIVNEKLTHFISAVPQMNKSSKQLSFLITFPEDGIYKMVGTFYVNGSIYTKSYVVNVGKR
ncbi:hypothetical protein [Ectobacillus polymachus]|uniref:hypothetical protein n=1 Tax=Ectobacillus polymachus TaxID=1508806 RepID=UPI003A851427